MTFQSVNNKGADQTVQMRVNPQRQVFTVEAHIFIVKCENLQSGLSKYLRLLYKIN